MLSAEAIDFFTQTYPMAGYALMTIGGLKVAEHGLGLVRGLLKHILRPRRWLKSRYADVNAQPWAVISGKYVQTSTAQLLAAQNLMFKIRYLKQLNKEFLRRIIWHWKRLRH